MTHRAVLRHVREVGALQERAARATPAMRQEDREGCWLRYTDSGLTWWAGAAITHGPADTARLDTAICAAEASYARHGTPARFQVCPACPAQLDDALVRRGYRFAGAMSLQVAAAGQVRRRLAVPPLRVALDKDLDPAWFRLWMAAQGRDADPAPEWRMLRLVDRPSAYVTVFRSDRPVAVGRAVADSGWVGVFGMATVPEARGQGAGRAVLAGLAGWTSDRGLSRMYLQVEQDNGVALRLYRRAGFRELAAYHYRAAATP